MRLLAVLTVLALATVARADDTADLAEARRLEATLEYEPALAIVERVIAGGTATTPAMLAERHLLAGTLAAGLDRPDAAKAHFARVLVLAPDTSLPAGTSPKLTEPFEAARVIAAPLKLTAIAWRTSVQLSVETDPLALVDGLEVVVDGSPLRVTGGKRVDTPAALRATTARALDQHGNVVWIGEVARGVDTDSGPDRPRPGKPLYRRWYVWGTATLVALAVGAAAGARMLDKQGRWDDLKATGSADYTVLREIESSGRTYGVVANISFGVAGVTGLLTALTFSGVF